MEIKPHKNLKVKQWYVLATISFLIILVGIILQILISTKESVSSSQVANILWPIIIGIMILLWLISIPLVILWIKNLTYFIEEERITINKGILSKIQQNIPYRAITDFKLHRSLYDRFLNIGAIRIQTAGQSNSATGYEGNLSGLEDWEKLHQQLRDKLKGLYPNVNSTTHKNNSDPLLNEDKLENILVELKAIRKALENQ